VKEKLGWYLAAIASTGIMATLGVFVREVSPGNEYAIALGRFGIGWLCLAGLLTFKRGTGIGKPVRLSWALVGAGVALPLFVVCYFKAVLSGTLANAAFLLYLGPLIASTLAALWLGEGFDRISVLLLGGALLGTLFITEFRLPDTSEQIESLVFGLLSGLFYGLFLLFNNSKLQGGGARLASTFYQFLIAAVVMIPVVAVTGVNLTPSDVPWVVAVGVIHGCVALTLVIAALGHLKTIEYGTISYGEPVTAALIGVIAYHERTSVLQVVGCLLVLAAGIARVLIREDSSSQQGERPVFDQASRPPLGNILDE
jgi:drug/metabolite transporter (DMT)-like permease